MRVRITQIDGALPNLALMRLAHWHRSRGDEVVVTRHLERDLFEQDYDRVYGSCLFTFSADRLRRFMAQWPDAIVGGTGTASDITVEQVIGSEYHHCDYTGYEGFDASIGFTQRGCRLRCGFCVVPKKEGKNRSTNTIASIWRGAPYPRHLHLLDNDFFGQPPDAWRARIEEIREGDFKVSLTQGINVRLVDEEVAAALASIKYRDTSFSKKRLYCAWDNFRDESVFFRGVEILRQAGIPPTHLMTYMLIGYDPLETWDRIWHRFFRMVEIGIDPYPMVYRDVADLKSFQRWVIARIYKTVPWDEYRRETRSQRSTEAYLRAKALREQLASHRPTIA